jgi:ABC-type multidrug transport system fused ATPase/permease subunit
LSHLLPAVPPLRNQQVQDTMSFMQPLLLKEILAYVTDRQSGNPLQPEWHGWAYCIGMFGVAVVQSVFLHQYFHLVYKTGMRLRSATMTAVYEKSLKLSNTSRQQCQTGEIINLMAVDANRFTDTVTYLHMLWSAPFQITLSLYFLYDLMGTSVFYGLAVMILLIPVNFYIAKHQKRITVLQMKTKDERIKMMNEVLTGIKVLKLYAWERPFGKVVTDLRRKELDQLITMGYLRAVSTFSWTVAPFFVSLATFIGYTVSGNDLTPEKAFVALSLFNLLRFPLLMLPMLINSVVQAMVSMTRVTRFLSLAEVDPNNVERVPVPSNGGASRDSAIEISSGIFAWEIKGFTTTPTLSGINLTIPPTSLTAIVGRVGCGKSSLINAMLGNMEKMQGRVRISSSVAYVPQEAWIQNATLRDNILFNKPFDHKRYQAVLKSCALTADLKILPDSDLTEIGEKGINLSGGQKQRVSLARAVYADAAVYLFDDPLSAVDAHVGKHIFERVIGPNGILKGKTRVLVTHGIQYLPACDQIISMKRPDPVKTAGSNENEMEQAAGTISEVGAYDNLIAAGGHFAGFIAEYATREVVEDSADEADLSAARSSQIDLEEDVPLPSAKSVAPVQILGQSTKSLNASDEKAPLLGERKGALIKKEVSATGAVLRDIYKKYITALGAKWVALIVVMQALSYGAQIGSNKWLSIWSEDYLKPNNTANFSDVYGPSYAFDALTSTLQQSTEGSFVSEHLISTMACSDLNVDGLCMASGRGYDSLYNTENTYFNVTSGDELLGNGTSPQSSMDSATLTKYLGVYGALGVGYSLGMLVAGITLALAGVSASEKLHSGMLDTILRVPMLFFDTTPLGRIVNRFSQDVFTIDQMIPQTISSLISCFGQVLSTVIAIAITVPLFLIAVVPLGGMYYIIQRYYIATSRQLKRIESVSRSPIYAHFSETLSGVSTIRAYGKQALFTIENENKVDYNLQAYYPGVSANRWLAMRLEFLGNLAVLFAAIFSVNEAKNNILAGDVGFALTYAMGVTQTLNWMVRMATELETNIVAVERVDEYSKIDTERPAVMLPQPPNNWPHSGKIVMENLGVRYRPGLDLVLRNVNCTIEGGEKIGVVGRTGAGKSSLMVALFNLIEPATGRIVIDGEDLSKMGLDDLRSKLTIMPQDAVLFAGTVRSNIDPFGQYPETTLWQALETAHLKGTIGSLEGGLETTVNEGGSNFSVGQRQLICLARAVLRKTKVLVLDEATAACDLETDTLIQKTIRTEFKACTVLTIAHRLNTIIDSTRVMVLDKGEIVEFDTPENLISNKESIFFGMAKADGLIDSSGNISSNAQIGSVAGTASEI